MERSVEHCKGGIEIYDWINSQNFEGKCDSYFSAAISLKQTEPS